MPENKKTILFIFNQLLDGTRLAGGEVRGFKIFQFFSNDRGFSTDLMLPKKATGKIGTDTKYFVGNNFIENYVYYKNLKLNPIWIFILYFLRTFESLRHIKSIDVDIVYSTGDFFCDTIPAFFIKIFHSKTKWVCCVHHINEAPFGRRQVTFISALVSYVSQRLSFLLIKSLCDQVFSINPIVKKHMQRLGVIASKIFVVGNGLDIKEMDGLREKYVNIRKENKICFFSRLSSSKGVLDLPEILSEVLKKLPDLKLEIIGGSEKSMPDKINVGFEKYQCRNNVKILGFVEDKEEVFKRMLSSRVMIFPTYEEGWGFCLFEAILLKLPVVVYNLPIFDELFRGNLLSVPVGERKQFAEKVLFCLDPSNAEAVSMAVEKCYQVAAKYDWENVFNSEKQRIQLLL